MTFFNYIRRKLYPYLLPEDTLTSCVDFLENRLVINLLLLYTII